MHLTPRFHRVTAWFTSLFAAVATFAQPQPTRVPPGVRAVRDLAYVSSGHERQKLDLFLPETATGPRPLVVWIHGGGWRSGDKRGCPPLRLGFVERGYVVASLNYRLSQDAVFPAQLEDCKAALRWLRAHAQEYQIDPEHVGVWGSSAGGHLVALLGTTGTVKDFDVGENLTASSRVQCVIDDWGPTDFEKLIAVAFAAGRKLPNEDANSLSLLIGGPVTDPANHAKVQRANPIAYVSRQTPPFLIEHGDHDPVVPYNQSVLLFDALKAAGVPVRLHLVKGAAHGAGIGGPDVEAMRRDFLDYHLLGKKTGAETWPVAMTSTSEAIPIPPKK